MQSYSSQYSNEAYDYPPNIRESFNDLGRTISEKVTLLSNAGSPAEAQAALTAPPSAKPQPKTFNHAIARAALAGSQSLNASHAGAAEDPLATALEKYALAEEKVGEARLAQDAQIQSGFLSGWSTTLNTNIQFATRARRAVENARLSLDATKGSTKNVSGQGMNPDEEHVAAEKRAEIERKEDEFVGQTEEAVGVMKNVGHSLHYPPSSSCRRMDGAFSLPPGPSPPLFRRDYAPENPFADRTPPGPRHPRTPPQHRRPDRRPARVPQEGLRDPQRAGPRRRRPAGRAGGLVQEGQGGELRFGSSDIFWKDSSCDFLFFFFLFFWRIGSRGAREPTKHATLAERRAPSALTDTVKKGMLVRLVFRRANVAALSQFLSSKRPGMPRATTFYGAIVG